MHSVDFVYEKSIKLSGNNNQLSLLFHNDKATASSYIKQCGSQQICEIKSMQQQNLKL